MVRLSSVNLKLPSVCVMGGPMPSKRIEVSSEDGRRFLILSQLGTPGKLCCVDLHDAFSDLSTCYPRERRILSVIEPPMYTTDIHDCAYHQLSRVAAHYGHVWTPLPAMLAAIPQAKKIRVMDTWAKRRGPEEKKQFCVTAMFSHKTGAPGTGYHLRKVCSEGERQYKVPTRFYTQEGRWLGVPHPEFEARALPDGITPNYWQASRYRSKDCCFDAMFHIAIENTKLDGYCTEKLMDCFATCTVPLYWGDPGVGEIFDERGIIRLDDKDPVGQINSLTVEDYESRKPYILENWRRSAPYASFGSALIHTLHKEGVI